LEIELGKWDFDADEAVFFLAAAIVALIGLFRWYCTVFLRARMTRCGGIRAALSIVPILAWAMLGFVLTQWADAKYVVGQLDYQLMFFVGGMMWLWIIGKALPILGVDAYGDAIERGNASAAAAVCGAMLGAMAIYAGSNVGSGPTIWTTITPAFVATAAWLAIWLLVEVIARPSESIAIDRDLAGCIRHAGFLLASGLVLGRAAAGDWTSWKETFDGMLRLAWPLIPLTVIAIVLAIMLRPTRDRPQPGVVSSGLIPAAIFLLVAIGYLFALGPADIGKHVITYERYMQSK
jgi:hypothetical protein